MFIKNFRFVFIFIIKERRKIEQNIYFDKIVLQSTIFLAIKINPFCFADDLSDTRLQLTEVNRRYHELEIEIRRLENEREELTAAYRESEAVSFFYI